METTNELLGGGVEYAAVEVIVRNGSMFLRWRVELSFRVIIVTCSILASSPGLPYFLHFKLEPGKALEQG